MEIFKIHKGNNSIMKHSLENEALANQIFKIL